MDKFLDKHELAKVTQEEIENLSSPITIEEIECAVKDVPTTQLSFDR